MSVGAAGAASFPPVADIPFVQEYRTEVSYPENVKQVRALAVGDDGSVWIASKSGVFHRASGAWTEVVKVSAYAIATRGSDVWAGAWDGLYRISGGHAEKIAEIESPIVALTADAKGLVAASQTALYQWDGQTWTRTAWKGSKAIRAIAREADGGLWVATQMGAYHWDGRLLTEIYKQSDLVTGELRAVAMAPDGSVWMGGLGGLDVYRVGHRAEWFNSSKGMASQDVRCLAVEPDGTVWIGTALGALRRIGDRWSLRHSRRWLPSDDVVAIAVAKDRTVWIATTGGLSAIHRRPMTLAEKADHYLTICLARHVRPPYLVEQIDLKTAGDTAHYTPRDDDNDGQYTGMYLAMESFRYAVTKDPQARENAKMAFHALKFLQDVTGTSGFFARTVVPSDWTKVHDGNEKLTAEERTDRLVENARAKPIENRWRPSADGKWLWKGDTSSDETSGHYYGYFTYYTLAADDSERQVIREHVRRITDHIIEGGYTFRDIDGQPTLWGVWSPEKLNHDPEWRAERWGNALEILAYLRIAGLMTSDPKYRRHYLDLIEKHHYGDLARRPLGTEPSERTHFDHELVAMVLPAALTEEDPRLRKIYEDALAFWLPKIKEQYSSFFSFTWAALAHPKFPAEFALDNCIEFLRDEPLDLVQWTVDNRKREDVRLGHEPQLDDLETDRVLPPSERGTIRWDGNPWSAVHGEDGMSESSGVHWLLPYWMGRYYGFIGAPIR